MVSVKKEQNNFIFNVKGMHKLWAFKSELSIPSENVINAHADHETIKGWKGFRMPGTSIPSVITAGTFYKDGNKIFWDVANMDNCIIIDLKDEEYKQLVIEVENPAEAIGILTDTV